MKKILLSISLLATTILFSQNKETHKSSIKKGTWVINTNINYNNRNNNNQFVDGSESESKFTHYSFTPNAGFLIKKNLEIGIGLGLGFSENRNKRDGSFWNRSASGYLSANTYIKAYKSINDKLFLNLKGELTLSRQFSENSFSSNNDITSNIYFIGLRPGATYFLSKKIALEFSLGNIGYSKTITKLVNSTDTDKSFSVNLFDSSYTFGVSYYL